MAPQSRILPRIDQGMSKRRMRQFRPQGEKGLAFNLSDAALNKFSGTLR